MHEKHKDKFNLLLDHPKFSRNKNEVHVARNEPFDISNSGIWGYSCNSKDDNIQRTYEVLKIFGYPMTSLKINELNLIE